MRIACGRAGWSGAGGGAEIGESAGDIDIVVDRVGDQLGKAEVHQRADAHARDVVAAFQRDKGEAGEGGMAGGGAAVEGEGIQGQVHLGEGVEILIEGYPAFER